jgi:hypothetical protein
MSDQLIVKLRSTNARYSSDLSDRNGSEAADEIRRDASQAPVLQATADEPRARVAANVPPPR